MSPCHHSSRQSHHNRCHRRGLPGALVEPVAQQHVQPELPQGGELHSEAAGLLCHRPGGHAGGMVKPEGRQHSPHAQGEQEICCFSLEAVTDDDDGDDDSGDDEVDDYL